jgi:hypothetical protein
MHNSLKDSGANSRSRPKKKSRKLVYQLRMNEDEAELLDLISYATDDSKADVLRKALKMYASAKKGSY